MLVCFVAGAVVCGVALALFCLQLVPAEINAWLCMFKSRVVCVAHTHTNTSTHNFTGMQ